MSDFQTLPTRLNVLSTSVCTFQHAVFCFGCSGSEDSAECTAICQGASASSWNLVLPCQTFWGWLVIVNVPLDGIIKVMCLALPRWEPKGTFNLTRHSILITCRFPIFVFLFMSIFSKHWKFTQVLVCLETFIPQAHKIKLICWFCLTST